MVISISQKKNDKVDESQKDSGAGDRENGGEEDSEGSEDKGKGRDRDNDKNPGDIPKDGDHDPGDPGDRDEGPNDLNPGEAKETMDPLNIKFEVVTQIHANGNLSKTCQEIVTTGHLCM